jgi:hypothetical protein
MLSDQATRLSTRVTQATDLAAVAQIPFPLSMKINRYVATFFSRLKVQTMSHNKILLALCMALVVIALLTFELFRQGVHTRTTNPVASWLTDQIRNAEFNVSSTCITVTRDLERLVDQEVRPLLEDYRAGRDWRARADQVSARASGLDSLLQLCMQRSRLFVDAGKPPVGPLSQELSFASSLVVVPLANGLRGTNCIGTCIENMMVLLDTGAKELTQALKAQHEKN